MNLTRDPLYVRSDIVGKAQRGKWTANRAEAVAKKLGVGPLAETPNPLMYDPLREALWTMPMAVSWIAWRTADAVRDAWDAYRENCLDWRVAESRDGYNGPISTGSFLERRPKVSMQILVLGDSYDRATAEGDSKTKRWMSPAAAEEALIEALRIPCFEATGLTGAAENRTAIAPLEWLELKCFSDRVDYYSRSDAKRGAIGRYDSVLVPSRGVTMLWPAPKPKLQLPPLLKPEGPGYMPLVCAAQWIAAKGGQLDFDPSEIEPWRFAFQELLDRVASNEVHISGINDSIRESIDGVMFAGCQVDYPYCDATGDLCWSEDYYIMSYPYLDEEHWRRGFDDSFRNRDKVRWKQLMVAKADVHHFWPFSSEPLPKSGAAGRPTSMHLVIAEFTERVARGHLEETLSKQATVLAEWLVQTHRNYPPAGRKAIESGIRHAFWAAKNA